MFQQKHSYNDLVCISSSNFKFWYYPGWGGGGWVGWVESIIRLISAEAEAEALLGLAELGNNLNTRTK